MSNYGPSEAWYRDRLFENPRPLVQAVHECAYLGLEKLTPEDEMYRWREFQTKAGRIDLLIAFHKCVLVIECKRDTADEGAVAQCLRYMGALQVEYGFGDTVVRGVCAAQSFTDGARFAAESSGVVLVGLSPSYKLITVSIYDSHEHGETNEYTALHEAVYGLLPEATDPLETEVKETA